MMKALSTLVGAAAAGALVWTAAQLDRDSTGGYWALLGVLAGAGLVLAVARLGAPGASMRPLPSPPTLMIAFVPVLIVAGWVLLAAQPDGNWFRDHVREWSGDIGVRGVVNDLATFAPLLGFGIGLVFGFCLDRVPIARRAPAPAARTTEPAPAETTRPAEPERDLVYSGSPED
jgi:hypothetical protein